MEHGEKFKKSVFGGFDRKDVVRCLEEMQQQNHAELEQLRLELEALRQERDALRRQVSEQKAFMGDQTEALAHAEEQNASLRAALEEAESRNDALQKELSAQKAINSELLMKKNVLEENCRQLSVRAEELEEKNPERAALALGELMVEAKVNAGLIEEEARQRAARADAVVAAKCEETDRRIEMLKAHVGTAMAALREFCDSAMTGMEQMSGQLEDFRTAVRETIPSVEAAASEPVCTEETPAEEPAPSFRE